MNDKEFCKILEKSFKVYLDGLAKSENAERSNKKLKILHGAIANDISCRLGKNYIVKSLGFNDGKEMDISGRYYDKKVDISIYKNNKIIAALGIKFVMSNYSQNANNYFEGMLGETANLRSNKIAYFQIIILPSTMPYFNREKNITKIENIKKEHLDKYINLSQDNINNFFHIPTKTLLYLIDLPNFQIEIINNKIKYANYMLKKNNIIKQSKYKYIFDDSVIYNNYCSYIQKLIYFTKSI